MHFFASQFLKTFTARLRRSCFSPRQYFAHLYLLCYAHRLLPGNREERSIQMQEAEPEAQPQEAVMPSLEQQLAEVQEQKQTCLDALLRSQADFSNFKRRATQEQAEARGAAQAALLETLLPVLDDLGRALESAPAKLANQPWVQGIRLVAKQLSKTLQQLGVRQIGSQGEDFDPRWHEAIMIEPHPDLPEGTIVQVSRPGYALGDRIIRPAQVVVSSTPVTAEETLTES
jgi:molecular chaperone GrpE